MAQNIYKGEQLPPQSEAGRLGKSYVGPKELSGFSENNDRYVHSADNPARFVTHYMTKYVSNISHLEIQHSVALWYFNNAINKKWVPLYNGMLRP